MSAPLQGRGRGQGSSVPPVTEASTAPNVPTSSLADKVAVLRTQLGLEASTTMKEAIDQAVVQLGLAGSLDGVAEDEHSKLRPSSSSVEGVNAATRPASCVAPRLASSNESS